LNDFCGVKMLRFNFLRRSRRDKDTIGKKRKSVLEANHNSKASSEKMDILRKSVINLPYSGTQPLSVLFNKQAIGDVFRLYNSQGSNYINIVNSKKRKIIEIVKIECTGQTRQKIFNYPEIIDRNKPLQIQGIVGSIERVFNNKYDKFLKEHPKVNEKEKATFVKSFLENELGYEITVLT